MSLVQPNKTQIAKIKVVGIGGGGGNTVNHMIDQKKIQGVEFIVANTDAQALLTSSARTKVQLGEKLTRGLGAGGNPKTGEKAALESKDKIKDLLKGADMIFLTGGMGGGTASGASHIIADIAKNQLNILTVGVVTKPFFFEGTRRMVIAEEAISKLKSNVDTLITVPNQKLMELNNDKQTMLEAFEIANSVLSQGVKGISNLITRPGLINLDFADIKSIMQNAGTALLGVGQGKGKKRAQKAIMNAIDSPLLDISIEGARGILLNITGGEDMTMTEVENAAQTITEQVGRDANIIFGAVIEPKHKGVEITVIATGFNETEKALSKLIQTPKKETKKKKTKTLKESKEKYPELSKDDLPEGVEIDDPFDIPAFLRKQK